MERFELIRNAGHVRRCHVVQMIGEQTVADHTFGVIAIILELWPESRINLIKAALCHDVPEYITGDVPATAKWQYPQLSDELQDVEGDIIEQYGLGDTLTMEEMIRLKLADLAELAMTCFEQMTMGNANFNPIFNRAVNAIRDNFGAEEDGVKMLQFLATWAEQKRLATGHS